MPSKTPSLSSSTQQPSVSQFFKRKSPPPPASSSSPASAKRVKLEHSLPSDEVIILDSDDDDDNQAGQSGRAVGQTVGLSDNDDIEEVHLPAASSVVNSVPAPFQKGASPSRPLPPPSPPVASSSKSAASRPPPSLAPIFHLAQAGSRPSFPPPHVAKPSSTSTRPIKRSAAAQALRSLTFIDPEDDQSGPVAGPSVQPLSEEEVRARARRHERFATKLLGRTFGRRRSLDLDEAEERGGLGGSDDMGWKSEGEDEVMALDEDSSDGAQPPAKKGKMAELKRKLVASSSSKTTVKKKAAPKIGPSGLSYTPLELQVRSPGLRGTPSFVRRPPTDLAGVPCPQVKSLKEANPGVLLIFEGTSRSFLLMMIARTNLPMLCSRLQVSFLRRGLQDGGQDPQHRRLPRPKLLHGKHSGSPAVHSCVSILCGHGVWGLTVLRSRFLVRQTSGT